MPNSAKGIIEYRVPEFLYCHIIWVPPFPQTQSRVSSNTHLLAGEGVGGGGPKAYERRLNMELDLQCALCTAVLIG
jgi:hypothetical protein